MSAENSIEDEIRQLVDQLLMNNDALVERFLLTDRDGVPLIDHLSSNNTNTPTLQSISRLSLNFCSTIDQVCYYELRVHMFIIN